MTPSSNKTKELIIGFLIGIILLGGGYGAYQVYDSWSTPPLALVSKPVPATTLTQSALITPESGGTIRTADTSGTIITLTIPPGAVSKETEVSLAPLRASSTSIMHGAYIEPTSLVLKEPATLTFNWGVNSRTSGKVQTTATLHALTHHNNTKSVTTAALMDALQTSESLPIAIAGGGTYGLTTDTALAVRAAKATFTQKGDALTELAALQVIKTHDKLTRHHAKRAHTHINAIRAAEAPELTSLRYAERLAPELTASGRLIHEAYAYGTLDGYLQYRCNLKETSYEMVIQAMTIAMQSGFSEVADNCKSRAEQILIERARLINKETDRPVIDAIEVLQQMQLLGLDDGGEGKELASRLEADITATIEATLARRGQTTDTTGDGRVRQRGPSSDPLLGNESTMPEELLAVQVMPFIGINSFDEEGLKNFGEHWHGNLTNMRQLGIASCDMIDEFKAMGINVDVPEVDENCDKVRSDRFQEGIDVWQEEVNEMAEGVDAVQRNETPNENWNETSELDAFINWLEN